MNHGSEVSKVKENLQIQSEYCKIQSCGEIGATTAKILASNILFKNFYFKSWMNFTAKSRGIKFHWCDAI